MEWLSPRALLQLNSWRFAKRRADWRLGRWTAKHAMAACLHLPAKMGSLAEIKVRPAESGAPEVFLRNKWAPVTISLSHREETAICALSLAPGALGCDLEVVELRSHAFVVDYFAAEEQTLLAGVAEADQPWLVTLLWSAKESTLKVLHEGLRLDTRSVIVTPVDALRSPDEGDSMQEEYDKDRGVAIRQPGTLHRWHPLRVRHLKGRTFSGWWQHSGNLVRTIVAAPPPARPRLLNIPPIGISSRSVDDSDQARAA